VLCRRWNGIYLYHFRIPNDDGLPRMLSELSRHVQCCGVVGQVKHDKSARVGKFGDSWIHFGSYRVGGCKPGELAHSSRCIAVSA